MPLPLEQLTHLHKHYSQIAFEVQGKKLENALQGNKQPSGITESRQLWFKTDSGPAISGDTAVYGLYETLTLTGKNGESMSAYPSEDRKFELRVKIYSGKFELLKGGKLVADVTDSISFVPLSPAS